MRSSHSDVAEEDVRSVVLDALKAHAHGVVDDSMHLQDDLRLDSLEAVEFIMVIEDAFQIDIKDDDEEHFVVMSIGEMVDFILEKVNKTKEGTESELDK